MAAHLKITLVPTSEIILFNFERCKRADRKKMSVQTSHENSMSAWARKIKEVSGQNDDFVLALLSEELSKNKRLSDLGIPIYDVYDFILPEEIENLLVKCKEAEKDKWKISLRFSDLHDKLIFRQLDIDIDSIIFAVENFKHLSKFKARVSPYKVPFISGTFWVCHGNVCIESVFGPHKWLTKTPPKKEAIFGCSFKFPFKSVKYTTDDQEIRNILFRCLNDMTKIVLGLNINELSENKKDVYAEFHWHKSLGYRFLECSFSHVWTGERR